MTELVPIRTEATSSGTVVRGADGIDFSSLLDDRTVKLANSIDNVFAEVEPRPATDWSGFDVTTGTNASATHPTRSFYEPADWDEDEGGVEMTGFDTDATTSSLPFTGDEPVLPLADTTSDAPSMDTDVDFLDEASTFSMGPEQPQNSTPLRRGRSTLHPWSRRTPGWTTTGSCDCSKGGTKTLT